MAKTLLSQGFHQRMGDVDALDLRHGQRRLASVLLDLVGEGEAVQERPQVA